MSEPRAAAERIEEVVPGLWHWRVHDDRTDFVASSHAVATAEGVVVIDPVRGPALEGVTAVCLTAGSHQRSAWRLRRELGVAVWAPALARELEEEPDVRYGAGDVLPGGIAAYFTPGAGTTQHTLLDPEREAAFVPDLLLRAEGGELVVSPYEHSYDPVEHRKSLQKLLELPFSILCLAHGAPIADGARDAVEWAVAQAAS